MKAIAVIPGKPNSVHLADLAKPSATKSRMVVACWSVSYASA